MPYLGNDIDLSDATHCNISSTAATKLAGFMSRIGDFVGERHGALREALMLTERVDRISVPVASPYNSEIKPDDFRDIRFPSRHDGPLDTAGVARYARTTQAFEESYRQTQNWPHTLDKIVIAMEGVFARSTTWRGMMEDMVSAGLRVPIAALPDTYLIELSRKVSHYAKNGGIMSDLSQADRVLLGHWYEMAQQGIDPVFGSYLEKEGKPELFTSYEFAHYTSYLKPFVDRVVSERQIKETRSEAALTQQV